jgi:hypothetical protein
MDSSPYQLEPTGPVTLGLINFAFCRGFSTEPMDPHIPESIPATAGGTTLNVDFPFNSTIVFEEIHTQAPCHPNLVQAVTEAKE